MLNRFDRLYNSIKMSIVSEQADEKGFKNSSEIMDILLKKYTFNEFKNDESLMNRIRMTSKQVLEESLEKLQEKSLEGDTQDSVLNQIYHYLKEFLNKK